MRIRPSLPLLYRAAPVEALEPRRLFSADAGRLAYWADPGVVDPNSIPPEEAIVEEAIVEEAYIGDGDVEFYGGSEEYLWEGLFVVDPLPTDGEYVFDPAICYFGMPTGGEFEAEVLTLDGEVSDGEPTEGTVEELGEVDWELIDPVVWSFGFPEADGSQIRTLDGVVESGEEPATDPESVLIDPAVCYAAPFSDGDVEITMLAAETDPVLVDPAVCFPAGEGWEVTEVITEVIDEEVPAVETLPTVEGDPEMLYTVYTSDLGIPVEASNGPSEEAASDDGSVSFVQTAGGYDGIESSDESLADLFFADGDEDELG